MSNDHEEIVSLYLEAGNITENQARLLKVFLNHQEVKKTAKELKMREEDVEGQLKLLACRGLIKKIAKEQVYQLKRGYRREHEQERLEKMEVDMSEKEREWMLDNYHKYYRNRTEASRRLARGRADVCNMAVALNIDLGTYLCIYD